MGRLEQTREQQQRGEQTVAQVSETVEREGEREMKREDEGKMYRMSGQDAVSNGSGIHTDVTLPNVHGTVATVQVQRFGHFPIPVCESLRLIPQAGILK